jgi:3-phenylpropionate/cinnamic acid dioxygenase small subunit
MSPSELHSVQQFLFLEARLLDERRLEEWALLFTDDGIYWAPTDLTADSPDTAVSLFFDDRRSMDARIKRLRHPEAHVAIPHSNTAHMLGNIEAEPHARGVVARAVFHVAEYRHSEPRWYAGRVEYTLVPSQDRFRIALKKVMLVNSGGSLTSMAFYL